MSGSLFRKTALEKLSTPDQLDRIIAVTSPRSWLALLAIAIALGTALLWGIFGTISYKVSGSGMLIKTGGLFNICHNFSGKLIEITIREGNTVNAGTVIARVDQTDTMQQINDAAEKIKNLKLQREKTLTFNTESQKKNNEYYEQEAKKLQETIKNGTDNLNLLKEKLASQSVLFSKGLLTKDTLLTTKQQINTQEESIASSYNDLKSLEVKKVENQKSNNDEVFKIDSEIKEAKDNMNSLVKKYEDSSKIIAPYSGRVIQISTSVGKSINIGDAIATIELPGQDSNEVEAVTYVPISEGKLVKKGMDVRISPSIVKKEEYGFILGKVTEVSEYPVTSGRIKELLANDDIVSTITKSGAVIEVKASLYKDDSTLSGYKWSSEKGPPLKIQSGTFCETLVTYKNERPINLVIPIIKKWTGIYY
ncbi:MAG: NHLP bacteriocin system secretion protein [Candidatus Wallbacteria bacterium]